MTASAHPAVRGCLEACRRCEIVLDAVPGDVYSGGGFSESAVGNHLRHCIDHFECFNEGLDAGLIDYDARTRSVELERDPAAFRSALSGVYVQLSDIPESQLGDSVGVRTTAAPDSEPQVLQSTVARELAFLSSHVIHHLAVIAGLCKEHGVSLPEDISLAYSTAAYRSARPG